MKPLSIALQQKGFAETYQLNFLSPHDFYKFFIKLRSGEAKDFKSELDIALGSL